MTGIRRNLPPLALFVTFEAAARLGSFTRAAAEMGITQAAVSRQVRRLEEELGLRLFLRAHRRVEPTPAGRHLAATLTEIFGRLTETVEAIRPVPARDMVVVATTLAFAHFWLVPRLPLFRARHPGVRLRLISEDAAFDLRQDRIDAVVRYGRPPFADGTILASMADEVFPVASPALLERDPAAALPAIGLEWPDPSWLSWERWARLAGADGQAIPAPFLRFNHYIDAVQAAINGEGVVLGWRRLIAQALREGRLVRVGHVSAVPVERYHVLVPTLRRPGPGAQAFCDWLQEEFARDP